MKGARESESEIRRNIRLKLSYHRTNECAWSLVHVQINTCLYAFNAQQIKYVTHNLHAFRVFFCRGCIYFGIVDTRACYFGIQLLQHLPQWTSIHVEATTELCDLAKPGTIRLMFILCNHADCWAFDLPTVDILLQTIKKLRTKLMPIKLIFIRIVKIAALSRTFWK